MKVILYMAVSANGLINDDSAKTPWQDTEWLRYSKFLQSAGSLIVGRRTHDIMSAGKEYEKLAVKRVTVLTRRKLAQQDKITTAATPESALQQLAGEGFDEVLIGGGAETNAAFLAANLVNEIYLDVEPKLFGSGQPLLAPLADFNLNLRLLEIDQYGLDGVGLKYSILK